MRRLTSRYIRLRTHPLVEASEIVFCALAFSFLLRVFVAQAFYIPTRSMANTLQPLDHILAEKFSYRILNPRRGEIVVFNFGDQELQPDFTLRSTAAHAAKPAGSDASGSPLARSEDANDGKRDFVKRVIATEGEEIAFRNETIFIDGKALEEPYLMAGGTSSRGFGRVGEFALRIPGRRIKVTDKGVLIDGKPLDEALPSSVPPEAVVDRTAANFVRLDGGSFGILSLRVPRGHVYVMGDNRLESADSRYFGFVPVSRVEARALFTYWPIKRFTLL
ncbi:MAG: signal peptidase I [Candidatus Hydrogenedentota bacterium]